jgi:hypothetical protein
VEQDKGEDGFAHRVGKRPRKEPLFGGDRQTIEIRRTENKNPERCPPNDQLLENKTERQTVSPTRWEQEPGRCSPND